MNDNGLSTDGRSVRKWDDWAIWVLKTIEENTVDIKDLNISINNIDKKFSIMETQIKTRAGIIGAISGIVFAGIINLIIFLIMT